MEDVSITETDMSPDNDNAPTPTPNIAQASQVECEYGICIYPPLAVGQKMYICEGTEFDC